MKSESTVESLDRARACIESGKLEEALTHLATALEHDDNPSVWFARCSLLIDLKRTEQAHTELAEVSKRFPNAAPLQRLHGEVAHKLKIKPLVVRAHSGHSSSPEFEIEARYSTITHRQERVARVPDALHLAEQILQTRAGTLASFEANDSAEPFDRNATPKKLSGTWISLAGRWSSGFWHWLNEQLPAVLLAESIGFTGKYLVPAGGAFIAESLRLLGIDDERVHQDRGEILQLEEAWVLEPIKGQELHRPPHLLQTLRDRLLASVSGVESSCGPYIYVSRNRSGRARQVVNEADISSLLDRFGYQILHFEQLSLTEQLVAARGAEVLVGPHGAGMSHALFMPPGGTVIEFFSPQYVNVCIYSALQLLKLNYIPLTSINFDGTYRYGHDIYVTSHLLELILDRALNKSVR